VVGRAAKRRCPASHCDSRHPGGSNTDLHGGWRDGANTLGDVAGSGLKRVILLSDGQANEELTNPVDIAAQSAEWAARGITTSTYGLGKCFNEELMVAIARSGGGNHYYGDTADDLMELLLAGAGIAGQPVHARHAPERRGAGRCRGDDGRPTAEGRRGLAPA